MGTGSGLDLSPGCKDRLTVASSVACIVALIVSMLGLARAVFDVTWPVGESGVDRVCLQVGQAESDGLCLQIGQAESDSLSALWIRTAASLSSRSPRAEAELGAAETAVPPAAAPIHSAVLSTTVEVTAQVASVAPTVEVVAQAASVTPAGHAFPAPNLLMPEPEAQLQGEVHFEWTWEGQPLPEGLAFDLLIWSEAEDEEHEGRGAYGVVETDGSLARDVDLDYVETILEHGGGTYFWTVVVVQEEPYGRVGAWGEKRAFTYVAPEAPAERVTQSP